jgi:hypothetical protein
MGGGEDWVPTHPGEGRGADRRRGVGVAKLARWVKLQKG